MSSRQALANHLGEGVRNENATKDFNFRSGRVAMALDGTYGFVCCGAHGLGVGVFNIKGGNVVGSDYGGGRYHGTATEDAASGEITLDITFDVLPGMPLVQGTAAQEVHYSRHIKQTLPRDFGDGAPINIESPPGTVTAMVKRVPDEWEPAAFQGFTFQLKPTDG
jgi:hypothetical protein